ncbi:MAG: hypothetical protein JXA15_05650 [Spirochaetales bacterium]|nr:hypothetical protein [Spirochaetales bacterium]
MRPVDKIASDIERRAGALGADARASSPALEEFRAFFLRSAAGVPAEVLEDVFARFLELRGGRGKRPAAEAGKWLASVASAFLMEWDGFAFTPDEWRELADFAALGSGEMDLETLNYVMALALEHGGLS